jgi:hypothetical protein
LLWRHVGDLTSGRLLVDREYGEQNWKIKKRRESKRVIFFIGGIPWSCNIIV